MGSDPGPAVQKGSPLSAKDGRASGILLHPTSLPGPGGIGDLGPPAQRFLERIAAAGPSIWQVLPWGPTGYGNSPYQSTSAFAGNPLLISPRVLHEEGLLPAEEKERVESVGTAGRVDYPAVIAAREKILRAAHERFSRGEGAEAAKRRQRFERFREEQRAWLEDYALYSAIRASQQGRSWVEWPADLALRRKDALDRAGNELADAIRFVEHVQFFFFEQWAKVHTRANELGIRILGDVPIFVAPDSADVWARREIFDLEESGRPRVVAGVPPDYFSANGQLWGNPLFKWDELGARGFDWWIERLRHALRLADLVRIDHFRGFEAYWEIPAQQKTAIVGRWVKGPGRSLFDALVAALGKLPIVAEDLGEITDEVHALRDALGFPGMRVLQFGFGENAREALHAPHNFERRCVAYTGTHDNDTTRGWFEGGKASSTRTAEEAARERERVLRYVGTDGREIHWDLIRVLFMSVAEVAIVPMQDVLGLGSEARMNTP
ncbi:MAG TPA: 4-alpha-glucanotransferase, partial [bacterium]|nr:4-alpha-glucanotransferase [bacterium]